jgi:hypothetical protein
MGDVLLGAHEDEDGDEDEDEDGAAGPVGRR